MVIVDYVVLVSSVQGKIVGLHILRVGVGVVGVGVVGVGVVGVGVVVGVRIVAGRNSLRDRKCRQLGVERKQLLMMVMTRIEKEVTC